jgi:hypothetical protein
LRILPKQYYVHLETIVDADEPEFLVGFSDDLTSILKSWRASTRISPVWKLKHDRSDEWARDADAIPQEIIFISATNPAWLVDNLSTETLNALGPDDLWMTLGAYNIVVICYDQDVIDEISSVSENNGKSLERWWLNGQIEKRFRVERILPVNPIEFSVENALEEKPSATIAFEMATMPADDTLSVMILEMYALTSVIESRSLACFPKLRDDALGVEKVAAQLIPNGEFQWDADHKITDQKKRDLLLSLNAGLSRLASQALSGTTPITQTECHFWPHSFLGTGVANYALRNVTEFLTNAVSKYHFHGRYETALTQPFDYVDGDLKPSTDWLYKNVDYCNLTNQHVAGWDLKNSDVHTGGEDVKFEDLSFSPNPVTFFTGRDGFKNTYLTTSAPLMCVSGANCVRWNLGTISHEMTHRTISGKIERIFKAVRKACANFNNYEEFKAYVAKKPNTLGAYAEKNLMLFLANRVFEARSGQDKETVKNSISILISDATKRYSRQIEEVLVHIFDFYHFYGMVAEKYVEFVWQSWAVQPSIVDKIDEYILRTVIALSVGRYEHKDFAEKALGDFQRISKTPAFRAKISPFISLLDERLSKDSYKKNLISQVSRSEFLIRLFFAVFKSDELKSHCEWDAYANPNSRSSRIRNTGDDETSFEDVDGTEVIELQSGHSQLNEADAAKEASIGPSASYQSVPYNYKSKKRFFYDEKSAMPEVQFSNPLLFLRDFSRDDEPDAAVSAWLLSHLAFNWLPRNIEEESE